MPRNVEILSDYRPKPEPEEELTRTPELLLLSAMFSALPDLQKRHATLFLKGLDAISPSPSVTTALRIIGHR